jgi:hypothetical protein
MLSPAYCRTLPPCDSHDRGAALERVVHHGADLFRIELLAQRGRADDVEEQDADLLQRLSGARE